MGPFILIPGALALRRGYKDLTLPVAIIAGEGDKIVFKRSSKYLAAEIRVSARAAPYSLFSRYRRPKTLAVGRFGNDGMWPLSRI